MPGAKTITSKTGLKMSGKNRVPIDSVTRPIMQLRACCDRVTSGVLRKKMGFGSTQLRTLYVLAHKPEMTQKVIADFWDVTEASVSRQIGILVKQGLAIKKPQGLAITAKGQKALDSAMKAVSTAFENIFREFSDSDRHCAAKLLEDLIGKIRNHAHFK